jgi:hypothetical protein
VSGIWNEVGSPYLVAGDILIPNDSTLSIEPGVRVEFQGHYTLEVQGRLLAIGTVQDSILFTINDTTGFHMRDTILGGWNSIRITDTPEHNDSTIISYCRIEYGKAVAPVWHINAGGAICVINFDKVRISHCLITHNSAGGTDVPAGGAIHLAWSDVLLMENTISFNKADAGGAIQMHESNPVFIRNIVQFNQAREGGGISIGSLSNPTFSEDEILNNISTERGGGLSVWDGSIVTLTDVSILQNESEWGGGIGSSGVTMYFNDCIVNNNRSSGLGGGLAADFSDIYLEDCVFEGDSAGMSGGIHSWFSGFEVNRTSFSDNHSDFGGAIHADFSTMNIRESMFANNTAMYGGAIHIWNCDVHLRNSIFLGNVATSDGGALEYNADQMRIGVPNEFDVIDCQFLNNNAFRHGAVKVNQIADSSIIDLVIDGSRFEGNFADRVGAMSVSGEISGIFVTNSIFQHNYSNLWTGSTTFNSGAQGKVENCLFHHNQAGGGSSGGMGVTNGAFMDVMNCTFTKNIANSGGGIQLRRGGKATVTNCILWDNLPNQISLAAILDSLSCKLTVNYSDLEGGEEGIVVDTLSSMHWLNGNSSEDPLFKDTIAEDYHLQDGSTCIGNGIDQIQIGGNLHFCPPTDIEGNIRPDPPGTMPDMGAYESILGVSTPVHEVSVPGKPHIMNFPNPFRKISIVKLNIQQSEFFTLEIYDILGQHIETLFTGNKPAGEYEFRFDAAKVSPGTCILQLSTDSYTRIHKMINLE